VRHTGKWLIRAFAVAGALGVLLLVLVALLHTAPARNLVLRRAVLYLAERAELALDAESLHYNLATGRVSLSNVKLASIQAREDPFFAADAIDVTLPPASFFGAFSIERVRLDNARVALHRRSDGSWNVPAGGSSADEAPRSRLPLGRLEIPRLAVTIDDEVSGLTLSLPNVVVDVQPRTGQVHLIDAGRLAKGDHVTAVKTLGGGVAFDGRSVHLRQFRAETDDAGATLDGEIALLVSEPRLDLRMTGHGDVPALATWVAVEAVPDGTVMLDATVTGSISSPGVVAHLRSDALSYQGLTVSNIDADLQVDHSRLGAMRVEMSLAEGRVSADGQLTFSSNEARVTARWSELSVEQLVGIFAGSRPWLPAGRAAGDAAFTGTLSDLHTWTLDVSNRITASTASAGRLPVGGEASLRVNDARWQLDGTHTVAGAEVRTNLRGDIDPDQFSGSSLDGVVEARGTDVPRVMTTLGVAGVLDPSAHTVVAGRLDAVASLSGSIAKPAFQVSASGRGLSAFDVSEISLDAKAAGNLGRAVVEARVRQGSGNSLQITGTVWPDEARLDGRVTGAIGDIAALVPDVPVTGSADVRLDARGPFQEIGATGSISVRDAQYDDAPLGPVDAQFVLEQGVAHLDLSASDFGATAHADLRMSGARSGVVDLRVREARVERLIDAANADASIAGTVSLTGHAEGTLDDWRHAVATIEISAFEGRSDGLAIRLQEPARIWYDGGTLDVVSLEAALGETRLSLSGRYALLADAAAIAPGAALRGVLVGDLAHVVDAVRASGLVEDVAVTGQGPLILLTRVDGSGEQPLISADVELGPAEIVPKDLPPIGGVQIRARVADGWAELVSASGEWQDAGITAQGRVPLRLLGERIPEGLFASTRAITGPASLDVRAVSVTSQALAPFVPSESIAQIDGALDATVHLEAAALDWARLQGEARLDRLDLAVAGVSLTQQEPTRIVVENGIARLASWNWTGRGTSVIVQGEVRLPDQRATILAGGQIDLRLLTPFLASADIAIGGSLSPRVSVSGPFDDLRIEGDVTLAEGEVRLRDPDVIVTGLTATALLGRDRARITALNGQINGGSLTGSGEVSYPNSRELAGLLSSTISDMGLEFPEGLRSEIDADLRLDLMSADDELGGTLSGTVTVARSAYREPIAVVNQLLAAVRAQRLAGAVPTEPSFADRLRLNVRVLTDSDVIVDNNLAQLQLGGDLRLIGTAAAPALSGRATLREGGELFLGRNRYTIESGTIDFANPVTIEPDLNVQAVTRAGGRDIELTLKGTPETLAVDLRSTSHPELGQADIASLLLTGRELDEVSGAEAQIVGEQVVSYLSGDVLGAASRVVGLDTLRLGGVDPSLRRRDSAEIASETDPTSRLTFGKSLGDSLEVTLSQNLRDGGAQTWILDYTPLQRVDLRFVSDDDNLRSYQFRHDVTLGDTPRPARAPSRDTRDDRRVSSVMLTGDLGGPEDRLRRVIDIEPGDEFDFTAWQRGRDRLERALHDEDHLEARVSARREDEPGGVAITYQIEAGPLTLIRSPGYRPPEETIRAIETAWTHAIFDEALADETEDLVRRSLIERGYVQPSVEATMASEGTTKTLDIVVDPGERARERRIVVTADDEMLAGDIEEWARRSNTEALAWRDPTVFQRALVDELRRRGRANPEVRVEPARSEGSAAVVPVEVRAGPIVTIRDVRFDGATHVAAERLQQAAAIEPGAPYDPAAVNLARERVGRMLRGEGFAEARVDVKAEAEIGRPQVTVVFVIDEGPRQVLRDIVVMGNRSIDRDAVVRALDLRIGDPLGADAWLQARSRLFSTALFRRVDVTVEPIASPAEAADGRRRGEPVAGEQPARLVVTGEEWPALRVRYGLQVSEERPASDVEGRDITPGLSVDVTRRTLFGRAITVGGAAEYERRERLARGFLNTPTLFGLPVESLLTVERSREDIPEASVVTDRSGISWEQRIQLGAPTRVSYGYTYDRDHTFSTRPSDDPLNPTFDVTVNVARLSGSAVFDTRDNPLATTRGWLASSNLEYAPASLGSDIRFLRYLGQAYHFQPVRRLVLASAARIGLATALGGQSLIPSERFFAGGARTVRGVPENGLGPRDIFGDVAGGGALVVFNEEVRVPIYRWFSGVGFIDVGNVFERPSTIDFADLVGSFGGGLRVSTPFALLRADIARVLWSQEGGQPTARWTFGIGHTF
jgi:outer membrane protein assembly factor BamA/autotransporter translocation and assembly factor TamB